jgi:tetratricopeptide (TPR) repeat protein
MMSWLKRQWLRMSMVVAASMLMSCQSPRNDTPVPDSEAQPAEQPVPVAVQDEEILRAWQIEFRRQRVIGDLLYDALKALQQDRLLYPANDNAYDRYRRVLALDPENRVAREGLDNIVERYLVLAAAASRQGRFAAAQEYIERARAVNQDHPAIAQSQAALEQDRNSGDLVFELDLQALESRSGALVEQLADIAGQAVQHGAFVWITAPSDETGRWIYSTMREQVEGYRLRGNIEIGGYAFIRLRLPEKTDGASVSSRAKPG